MASDEEVPPTPREHFARETGLPFEVKQRTPRTVPTWSAVPKSPAPQMKLLSPAEIWRDVKWRLDRSNETGRSARTGR